MTTFFAILALLAPIAAIIYVPKWMKKNGKGKNSIGRMLAGLGCALVLLLFFGTLSSIFSPDEDQTLTTETIEMDADNQPTVITYPKHPKFTQIAYYKRDPNGDFNYRYSSTLPTLHQRIWKSIPRNNSGHPTVRQ